MPEIQLVLFGLNNELCGVDTLQVQEIIKHENITKSGDIPGYADGLAMVRGKSIPVVDLNRRFGMGETEVTKKSKIIITFANKNFVGFAVNDVLEIIKLGEADMEAAPDVIKKAGNSYVKGVGKSGEKLISILDLSKVIDEDTTESFQ